jgi:hypothetical protein
MESLISSLAVFRELYDVNKDIYNVLAEFIKIIIVDDSLFCFSVADIKSKLKSTFDFKIPDAIVKSTLKRMSFKLESGKYTADHSRLVQNQNITKMTNTIQGNTNNLLLDLYRFIETKTNKSLIEYEKHTIEDEFYNFLLDETDTRNYSKHIASYMVEKNNTALLDTIKIIREGLILYSGINYYDINNLGNWQDKLTIYMDTEVIFNMAGYNGGVYKLYFDDFYNYVKEINSKSKKLISLKYLDTTEKEIHSFFNSASSIVEGRGILYAQKSAMVSIVNGCKTPSDVQIKKADLFTLIKNNQIELEEVNIDVTKKNNFYYNILDNRIIEYFKNKFEYDVYQDLLLLNNISIRRNVKEENNFSNIGCIFLTGNKNIMEIAFDPAIRKNGTVPLATTVEWLTNKFWFKMNKGFGQDKTPRNTNIILKSQVVLSNIVNGSLSYKYDELMQEVKDKNLSREQAQNRIVELRKMPHKPEDITDSNIDQVLDFLTEDEIEKAIHEQELLKITAQEHEKRNRELQQQVKDNVDATFAAKKETLEALRDKKETLDITHIKILRNIKLKKTVIKIIVRLCCVILSILIFFIIPNTIKKRFTENQVSIIVTVVSIILTIISIITSVIKIKKIDTVSSVKKINEKIEEMEYKKWKFDKSEYDKLPSKIKILEKELNS